MSQNNYISNPRTNSFWTSCMKLSVEPAGFLLVLSMVVSNLLFQNIMMETICRVDLGYEAEMCKKLSTKCKSISIMTCKYDGK